VAAAAADLSDIGSALNAAHAAAAVRISSVLASGADEVSAAVGSLFSGYGQEFQALSAQVAEFHSPVRRWR
jgi:hypothetical protein